jgi:hypothetical protein
MSSIRGGRRKASLRFQARAPSPAPIFRRSPEHDCNVPSGLLSRDINDLVKRAFLANDSACGRSTGHSLTAPSEKTAPEP